MHKNKTNGKIYIGITGNSIEDRWRKGKGYKHCCKFWNAIQKYGWDGFEHIILFEDLCKEDAENMEIKLIREYNTTDDNFGYNIQNGGYSRGKMAESSKEKISLANGSPIYQYDRYTGEFIDEYRSAAEAGRILNIRHEAITSVCNKRAKSIGGYIFRHKSEDLKYGEPLPKIEFEESSNTHLRPVVQYDKQGNYIAEYPSIKDAEIAFGKKRKTLIWHCCNGKKPSALGYIWAYKGEPCIVQKSKRKKPVNQFSTDGSLVNTFESVKLAAKHIHKSANSIIYACKNENKILEGYLWKYA